MRDKRFVAEHRGGPLKKEQHHRLIEWACACSEHVIYLTGNNTDERIIDALQIAKGWIQGTVSVGEARTAAIKVITAANELSDPIAIAVSRSAGHAVATAHMADHSLVAARYALKAVKLSGKSIDAETEWQNSQLTPEIRELILSSKARII